MSSVSTIGAPPGALEVLEFWFGDGPATEAEARRCMKRWFSTDTDMDRAIEARFGALMAQAAGGKLAAWEDSPRGRLALILLLDQFSRNVYRGTARAFAQDPLALELTATGIDAGLDRRLDPLERLFFYMPLQHAESVEVQARSVESYERLAAEASEPMLRKALTDCGAYARRHRDIIAEFGRFPHRNAALGRQSTPAETAWLARGGSTFGQ